MQEVQRTKDRRLSHNRLLSADSSHVGDQQLKFNCSTAAETVKIQKTLTETNDHRNSKHNAVGADQMAKDFQDNKDVKAIIATAENARQDVLEESLLASDAAELTMDWCSKVAKTRSQYEKRQYQKNAQEAMTDTVDAALRAQDALKQVKEAKSKMENLITNLTVEPVISGLETALIEETVVLDGQIKVIDDYIAEVDAALEELNINVTVICVDATSDEKIDSIKAKIDQVEATLANSTNASPAYNSTSEVDMHHELLATKSFLLQEALQLERAVKEQRGID